MPGRRKTTRIKPNDENNAAAEPKKRATRSRDVKTVGQAKIVASQDNFATDNEGESSDSDWEKEENTKRPRKRNKLSSPTVSQNNRKTKSPKFTPFTAVVSGRLDLSEDESSEEEADTNIGNKKINSPQIEKQIIKKNEINKKKSDIESEQLKVDNKQKSITSENNQKSKATQYEVKESQKTVTESAGFEDPVLSKMNTKNKPTTRKNKNVTVTKSEINKKRTVHSTGDIILPPKAKRSRNQPQTNNSSTEGSSLIKLERNNDDINNQQNADDTTKQKKGKQTKRPSEVLSEKLIKSNRKAVKVVVPLAKKKHIKKGIDKTSHDDVDGSVAGPSTSKYNINEERDDDESDDDGTQDEWEDVDEKPSTADVEASPSKIVKSKEVEISVAVKSLYVDKKAKKRQQLLDAIERCARKYKQENQTAMHKTHLLCLVARGRFYSNLCNHAGFKALCLSLIPTMLTRVPINKWNVAHTKRVVEWFKESMPAPSQLIQLLQREESIGMDYITETHLLVILLRSLGLMARLTYSLQPVTWKVLPKSKKVSPKQNKSTKRKLSTSSDQKPPKKKVATSGKRPVTSTKSTAEQSISKSPYFASEILRKKVSPKRESKTNTPENTTPLSKLKRIRKILSYKEKPLSDEEPSDATDDEKNMKTKRSAKKKSEEETTEYRSVADASEREYKYRINKKLVAAIDNDDEFEECSKPLSTKSKKTGSKVQISMLSSSSSESSIDGVDLSDGLNLWVETYLPAEKKWICIELSTPSLDQASVHEKLTSKPIQYIVAFDNDLSIKDVTCRYDSKWLSQTRRQRIDREWWADVIDLYPSKHKTIDRLEDTELHTRLLEQPLPKSIGEFKGHALFALERHLLKYEAIYPRTALTVGFIRGEAVYSRDCVHQLHSRENWMMEALVVRNGEEPYKIVRGRPKKNTPIHERDKVKLELYGKWQTDVYKPPRAKNGIVPKNEYGNVELFKPCMLPPGTVHVPIQGIQKVAKKLKIDVAPAMMGWDFHAGHCHPIIEGVIVCKEFEQQLMDGWNKEEDENSRKIIEKREKKIFDRWRHIIKSMLVKERLSKKYDFEESHQ